MLWIQYVTRLGGRLKSGFDESSTRTKKHRSEKLSKEKTLNELLSTAIVLLKKFGRVEDAKIVYKILSQSEDGSCSIKEIGNHCLQKKKILKKCTLVNFAVFFVAFLKYMAPKTYKSIYMYFAHIFGFFFACAQALGKCKKILVAFLKFLAPKTYKLIYNMYFAHIFAIF